MGLTLGQFSTASKNFFVANQKPLETAAVVVGVTVALAAATVVCPAAAPEAAAVEDGVITGAVAGDAVGGLAVGGGDMGLEGGLGATEAGSDSSSFSSLGTRFSLNPADYLSDAERVASKAESLDPYSIASAPSRAMPIVDFGLGVAEDDIGASGLTFTSSSLETAGEDSSIVRGTMEGSVFSIRSSAIETPNLDLNAEEMAGVQDLSDDSPLWSTMGGESDQFNVALTKGAIPEDQLVLTTLRNAGLNAQADRITAIMTERMAATAADAADVAGGVSTFKTAVTIGGILGTGLAAGGINMILQNYYNLP